MSLRLGAAITDRVNIGSGASIANLNPMTALAWVLPTSLVNNRVIYFKGPAGSSKRLFRLNGTGGNLQFAAARTGTLNYVTNTTPLAVVNRWYLVAVTFDTGAGAGEIANIYTGTETSPAVEATYGTASDSSGATTDDSADEAVWGNTAANDSAFPGLIAYGALFNRVFRPGEIVEWQYKPFLPAGCRDFHRFGGPLGTGRQVDLSGLGNHGVVTGAIPGPEIPSGLVRKPRPIWFDVKVAAATGNQRRRLLLAS